MAEAIEPMATPIDQQQLAEDLAARARAEGIELVDEGAMLNGLAKSALDA